MNQALSRDYKWLLTSFVQIVTFVLGAFGGFLIKIAPPQQTGSSYAVGVLSFLDLIALLIVSALARTAPSSRFRRIWIAAGIVCFISAIPPSFLYEEALASHTWWYPTVDPVQRVRGTEQDFTHDVKIFLRDHPEDRSLDVLAKNFEIDDIWSPESITHANRLLLGLYTWLVLSISTAIFCLLEANIRIPANDRSAPVREDAGGELHR